MRTVWNSGALKSNSFQTWFSPSHGKWAIFHGRGMNSTLKNVRLDLPILVNPDRPWAEAHGPKLPITNLLYYYHFQLFFIIFFTVLNIYLIFLQVFHFSFIFIFFLFFSCNILGCRPAHHLGTDAFTFS